MLILQAYGPHSELQGHNIMSSYSHDSITAITTVHVILLVYG